MSLRGVYQVGYVTHDIDRAIELMGEGLGLSDFSRFDLPLRLRTPNGEKTANVRVATAWVGATQIELIQPLSGHVDVYVAGLPEDAADPTPRFHHLAVRRGNLEDMQREIADLGLPIVFETGGAGINSAFVDTRARLGHHLEFVCASAEGWQILGWPDTAPV
jgi:hypothetical protein